MDATEATAVLDRARQGDNEAFRALVERHSRSLFRLAFHMTGNEQDAEDVVQDSFLRAYRQLGRFQARANFGTWLYRIVANCSVDLLRAKQARPQLPLNSALWPPGGRDVRGAGSDLEAQYVADQPGPDRLAQSAEIQRHVDDALHGLSP